MKNREEEEPEYEDNFFQYYPQKENLELLFLEIEQGGFIVEIPIMGAESITAWGATLEEAEEDFMTNFKEYFNTHPYLVNEDFIAPAEPVIHKFTFKKILELLPKTAKLMSKKPKLKKYFDDFLDSKQLYK